MANTCPNCLRQHDGPSFCRRCALMPYVWDGVIAGVVMCLVVWTWAFCVGLGNFEQPAPWAVLAALLLGMPVFYLRTQRTTRIHAARDAGFQEIDALLTADDPE